mgnify:CR=1 FL=1
MYITMDLSLTSVHNSMINHLLYFLEGKKGSMFSSTLMLRASSSDLGAENHPEKLEVVEPWDADE